MAAIVVDLDEAERSGTISPGQAEALRRASNPSVHDEPVQVTNRFSEVFVAIGCTILWAGAHAVLVAQRLPATYTNLLLFVIAWGLAEGLHRRRMGFATGVCVLLAAVAVHGGVHASTSVVLPHVPGTGHGFRTRAARTVADYGTVYAIMAGMLAVGLVRFRIPFLVLPTATAAATAIASYLGASGLLGSFPVLLAIGLAGACILALGVWADRQDPDRKGKPSQYAFWLFVAGSPMTVHPFLILTLGRLRDVSPELVAALVIAVSLAVTLLGLVLDRRGPVVSTLVYVTVAVGYLLSSPGVATLLIGVYVLSLGLLWAPARMAVAGMFGRRSRAGGDRSPTGGLGF